MSTHPNSRTMVVAALACALGLGTIAIAWQAKGADPSQAVGKQSSFAFFQEMHANAHLENLPVQ
jgi:hypothetical protein